MKSKTIARGYTMVQRCDRCDSTKHKTRYCRIPTATLTFTLSELYWLESIIPQGDKAVEDVREEIEKLEIHRKYYDQEVEDG